MTRESAVAGAQHARAGGDERLRSIIDRLADGVVIVGREGRVRFANPAAERLFGRAPGELVGEELGLPAVAGETTEVDVLRGGGEMAAAELRAAETEWEGEAAFLVSLRDVTDRRLAEERRRQVEAEQAGRRAAEADARRARFLSEVSAVLSSSLDYHATLSSLAALAVPELADWCVIDVWEEDGTLARIAAAHKDPAREPLLAELRELFPPDARGAMPAATALRTGRPFVLEHADDDALAALARGPAHVRLLRRLGIHSLMAVPMVSRSVTLGALTFVCADREYGENDLATAVDFAQRAAASVSNARLYEAAQEASRAKSEFLAVMSHELRTPLNAITGYADLLQAGVAGPVSSAQADLLRRVKECARSLVEIIEEILAFSRMEAGSESVHRERVDLRELVRETAALLEPMARQKQLGFEVRLPDEPAWCDTDAAKVRQVLRNLVSNAVKFTDRGWVRVEAVRGAWHHLVRVSDTGIGIEREHRERVFEPFWQVEQSTRREVGGTGLGLSVARGLAELLGGSLTLESTRGPGSTFTLALPVADSDPDPAVEPESMGNAVASTSE